MLGFGDETWWTRLAQPSLHTWTDEPVRLVQQSVAKDDPDPKALACNACSFAPRVVNPRNSGCALSMVAR